jgi:hypothetical protein
MPLVNRKFGHLTVIRTKDAFSCECVCSCNRKVTVAIKSLLDESIDRCHKHRTVAKKYTYRKKEYTTSEISDKFGVSRQTFMLRIHRGWSIKRAIETSTRRKPQSTLPPRIVKTWPYQGREVTIKELWEISKSGLGLSRQAIRARLVGGWTIDETLTIPLQQPKPGTVSKHGKAITRGKLYEYPVGSGNHYTMRQLARLAGININSVKNRLVDGWSTDRIVNTPAYTAPRRADVHTYEYRGQTYTIAQLGKLSGIALPTIRSRIRNNWDIESVVNLPVLTQTKEHSDDPTTTTSLRQTTMGTAVSTPA